MLKQGNGKNKELYDSHSSFNSIKKGTAIPVTGHEGP
jgi:hypothetical protein